MYEWLGEALQDGSQVVTASRRLARLLRAEYSAQRMAAGQGVWPTPHIDAWPDWLSGRLANADDQPALPTLISANQSRVLWERCLRREIHDPLLNISMLAKQSRDTWLRLRDWRVPIDECQRLSKNYDQRLFASAALSYQSILHRENWIDDAGLADIVIELIRSRSVAIPGRLTLAGFDRLTPQLQAAVEALDASGCATTIVNAAKEKARIVHIAADNSDAELRAAGHWARHTLSHSPEARLAIVVTRLEQDADRALRQIKEGMIPGWQNAGAPQNAVISISYGRKLTAYPAIAAALLALRWLHGELSTVQISQLLRSSLFFANDADGPVRVELRLRQLPDRAWSAQTLAAEIAAWGENPDYETVQNWLQKVVELRAGLPARQSPSAWVSLMHRVLGELGWPGGESPDSAEFQLINRWRELLNDVARLQLVSPEMTLHEAFSRLSAIAAETIYQAEAPHAVLNVLGPLEAAGMEFDALWVTGLSGANWPPPSRPLTLVSRDLQRAAGMPDASPADTLDYAERVIRRLAGSAAETVFSFPLTQNDAPQSASELLRHFGSEAQDGATDPGWAAVALASNGIGASPRPDRVPPMSAEDILAGGAATVQRHFVDPFAAFVIGRLGVRLLSPIASGLPSRVRGSLIHQALSLLYADGPSSAGIRGWTTEDIRARCAQAVRAAFWPHERHADAVLKELLRLEKERVTRLLGDVIALDCTRADFRIAGVEQKIETHINGLGLRLRVDRVDTEASGECVVLDYKTGMPKKLLDRAKVPNDVQLIVYAHALNKPVGGIGLINVDSRRVELDGVGRTLTPEFDWDNWLPEWLQRIELAAAEIVGGDVRINTAQGIQAMRPLGILGRHRELLRERR